MLLKHLSHIIAYYRSALQCRYTCMVATPYALALYLMYMPDDALEKTYFCVYDQIKCDIQTKLPHVEDFTRIQNAGKKVMWKFHLEAIFKYWFIRRTDIYAMDFLDYVPQLIGHHTYTCIEDGTGSYTFANDSEVLTPFELPNTWWGFKQRIKYGPVYGRLMGTNKYCINRLVTSAGDVNAKVLQGRHYTLLNWQEMWNNASENKKDIFKHVFSFDDVVLAKLRHCNTIILTQPIKCKTISEQEAMNVYAPYIEQYMQEGVVIKPHPAEFKNTDYTRYFPQTYVLNTKLPMQVLSAMGVHFKRAITIFSTAVSNLPKDTEIIWLGTEINEELYKEVGPVRLEDVIGKR